MKQPQNDSKYEWTGHAWEKMQYYGISEGRIKRIIRFPTRIEEGVADETVAVMQPAGTKNYQEIWVMYSLVANKRQGISNSKFRVLNKGENNKKESSLDNVQKFLGNTGKRIRIITAWRYPGKSSERDPIPEDVMMEIKSLL
ncbi:MAG: hypothetical protein AB1333_01700 [Patescibacteria group bacterium]